MQHLFVQFPRFLFRELSGVSAQILKRQFGDAVARRVVDAIKHLNAPRQALRTGATQPFGSETIESEVPKFKTAALIALSESIKFGVQFVKQVTILLRHRMSLHQIRSNGDHATLAENDAAMTLRSVNVQTEFLRKTVDVAGTVNLHVQALRA